MPKEFQDSDGDEDGDERADAIERGTRAAPGAGLDRARSKVSKGISSLVGGLLICAAFGWFYLRSRNDLLGAGAFLFGLGPALSGLKNLIQGLFELRHWKRDQP